MWNMRDKHAVQAWSMIPQIRCTCVPCDAHSMDSAVVRLGLTLA